MVCPNYGKHHRIIFYLAFLITFSIFSIDETSGHGRLIEPPSRASAWRYGFNTPPNYNDHELYCGGFTRQWKKNNGKCGICGDAYDAPRPRPHEFGGKYGQGVLVRKYDTGSTFTIRVEITANHQGYFEFRLCPEYKYATQECLDQYVLELARPQEIPQPNPIRFYPNEGNKIYEMRYKLPSNFSCSHCVLQWKYIAGNNWGSCGDGHEAVGCGPQEEFRACADVSIGGKGDSPVRPTLPTRRPLFPKVSTTTVKSSTTTEEVPGVTEGTQINGSDNLWVGVIISMVSFFFVCLLVSVLYLYYYHGQAFKIWLKSKTKSKNKFATIQSKQQQSNIQQSQQPVKPPRTKKLQRELSNVSVDWTTESLA